MIRIFTLAIIAASTLVQPASAAKWGCNPAVQNWNNGSGKTCPAGGGGGGGFVPNPAAPPAPVLDVPSDDCAATSGCGGDETAAS